MLTLIAVSLVTLQSAPQERASASADVAPARVEWRTFDHPQTPLRYAIVQSEVAQDGVARPVLFALPPGQQNERMVEFGLELYWAAQAARRGWIVVSPAAPEGLSLHAGAADAVQALAAQLVEELQPEGGRLHLAGVSNGGRTAFHLARSTPERWHTLTVAPGVPKPDAELASIAHLPLALFGGGDDEGWADGMRTVEERLNVFDGAHVDLQLFEGEGHVPPSLEGGELLFERIEEHRALALERVADETAVRALLDDFHDAASKADGERYFGHFAPGAVFIGTDATERWSVAEFHGYVDPYFSRGQGWTYVAEERWVTLSASRATAWFDERLQNAKYGETRGSGVLVKRGERWLLTQYILSIPVPNDLAGDLVERIRGTR